MISTVAPTTEWTRGLLESICRLPRLAHEFYTFNISDGTSLTAYCMLDACATNYESNMLVFSRSP